ncbi:MAG TPA: hypothetical protein PKE21_13760 [Flavobacteriales bacterium]|nr:hypothetical protein [Flavobacteriales bacterium]HMR28543.1 hypothetical protein [Flavobacteriales bacterium]
MARTYSVGRDVAAAIERLAAADHRSASNMLELLLRRGIPRERERIKLAQAPYIYSPHQPCTPHEPRTT